MQRMSAQFHRALVENNNCSFVGGIDILYTLRKVLSMPKNTKSRKKNVQGKEQVADKIRKNGPTRHERAGTGVKGSMGRIRKNYRTR